MPSLTPNVRRLSAFTLIELLVVIAIIAVLISILLPSLAGARASSRALKSANNARSIAQGVVSYTIGERYYPPSYVYAADKTTGRWNMADQQEVPPPAVANNGYIHWTFSMFDSGGVPEDAFKNPAALRGGAPATNPGTNPDDWEDGQLNIQGSPASSGGDVVDRQVKRLGYGANAALIPRNKFAGTELRKNQLVNPAVVEQEAAGPAKTILVAELAFSDGWRSQRDPSNQQSKSHRSITPFLPISGSNVYQQPNPSGADFAFRYPLPEELLPQIDLTRNYPTGGWILEGTTPSVMNAVGRFHPGGDKTFGGKTVFGFADGHVETLSLLETIPGAIDDPATRYRRLWGTRFYSLTGKNRVQGPRD